MRFRHLIGAALIAAAAAAPQAALAGGYYHCPYKVVLYEKPGHHHHHVAVAPPGAALYVYHCDGWCEVSWGTHRGWIQSRYVAKGYPNVARQLTITPVPSHHGNAWVPTYVRPQVAFLSSQTTTWDGRPTGRVWYYDGRFLDRPDIFRFVTR